MTLGIDPLREHEEHHFQNVEALGIGFDGTRVWVCINGASIFRAKWTEKGLIVEYVPPACALREMEGRKK